MRRAGIKAAVVGRRQGRRRSRRRRQLCTAVSLRVESNCRISSSGLPLRSQLDYVLLQTILSVLDTRTLGRWYAARKSPLTKSLGPKHHVVHACDSNGKLKMAAQLTYLRPDAEHAHAPPCAATTLAHARPSPFALGLL